VRTRTLIGCTAVAGCLVLAPTAGAATRTVLVGQPHEQGVALPPSGELNQFFPSNIAIHRGDRIKFVFEGFHNVSLPARGGGLVPFGQPDPSHPVAGVNDAAGQPFAFNGLPSLVLNPAVAFPQGGTTYTGKAAVGSGLPPESGPAKPFVVRFANKGTFQLFCELHPGMKATIHVKGGRVPSQKQVDAASLRQLKRGADRLRSLARQARKLPAGTVSAGYDGPTQSLLAFFPQTTTVKAGTTLTLTMPKVTSEIHSFTFGPQALLKQLGSQFISPLPGTGTAGPPTLGILPQAGYPSDLPTLPPYTGSNHGDGFLNTGILDSDPKTPFAQSAKVTFSTPGTYGFICVIHPFMHGTIKVV
jgi:plastocyanin